MPSRAISGARQYAAPEVYINARHAKPACDMYSAGATLHDWLLCGCAPKVPISVDRTSKLEEVASNLAAELGAVVARALELNPEKRFSSAREMFDALKPFM